MAIGYDTRPTLRQTFTSDAPAPVQTQSGATGQSRGIGIIGGESRGGVVTAGMETNPGDLTTGLSGFIETLIAPDVARRQQQKFFEGFVAAQSGQSIDEIGSNGGAVSKIFGPTGFQQGAEFYTARKAVTDWQANQLADMDRLKRLSDADLSKHLAETSQAMMTGDPFANQMIQASLIEASGPLISAVAKERYKFGQETAMNAASGAWASSANSLQGLMTSLAALDPKDPTYEAQSTTAKSSVQAFAAGMAQPHGMDDETYRSGLYSFMRKSMQDGQFYAVEVMRRAGIDRVFDDEQRTKLEDAYERYGKRVMGDVATTEPFVERMGRMMEAQAKGRTALEVAKGFADYNAAMRVATGIDEDFFDASDIKAGMSSAIEAVVSAQRRAVKRQQQLADMMQQRKWKLEDDAADRAAAAQAAGAAWASRDVTGFEALGGDTKLINARALKEFREGNLGNITAVFKQSGWVAQSVQQDVQAMVTGSIEENYNDRAKLAHAAWRSFYAASPGAAAAYFGKWHQPMQTFDTLQKSLGPNAAYRRAFGDAARFAPASIPAGRQKEAAAAIDTAVQSMQPSFGGLFGGFTLNATGLAAARSLLTDRVAMGMQGSDQDATTLAQEQLQAAVSDGSLQLAGSFAWRAAPGTKPFRALVGLQADEAGKLFHSVVHTRLKAAGFSEGLGTKRDSGSAVENAIAAPFDYFLGRNAPVSFDAIHYVEMPNGKPAVAMRAIRKDGESRMLVISIEEFRETQAKNRKRATAAKQVQNRLRRAMVDTPYMGGM